ncbi:IS66 family insertion sequence element accessory protein TnpB [Limobrevibacterium gyesilva]|uniref:IS66 family insertion sequence element accessory protein TnpB n=1 Tax=Limobrevibacterium gyesilva TaxID=2991712 RepID=UPI003241E7CD
MNGLALQVQQALGHDPHGGDLYVFRGKSGDLVKILWHDGLGMSLYAKRLETGRFIWPSPAEGWWRSRRHSSVTCLKESTGSTRSAPGGQGRLARRPHARGTQHRRAVVESAPCRPSPTCCPTTSTHCVPPSQPSGRGVARRRHGPPAPRRWWRT